MTTNPPESKFPTKAILGVLLAALIALAAAFGINMPADTVPAPVDVPAVVAPAEVDADTDVSTVAPTEPVSAVLDVPEAPAVVAEDAAVVSE